MSTAVDVEVDDSSDDESSVSEPLLNPDRNPPSYDGGTFLPDLSAALREFEENEAARNEQQSTVYRSLCDLARTAKENSNGFPSFLKTFYLEVYWAVTCTSILTKIFVSIPLGMIAVGVIYWTDCPAEPYIPIYLVTAGSAAILGFVLVGTHAAIYRRDAAMSRVHHTPKCLVATELIVFTFQLSWYLAGCWWIYSIYEPLYYPPGNYCGQFLYLAAFWTNNVVWILSGIFGLLVGLLAVCYCRV